MTAQMDEIKVANVYGYGDGYLIKLVDGTLLLEGRKTDFVADWPTTKAIIEAAPGGD